MSLTFLLQYTHGFSYVYIAIKDDVSHSILEDFLQVVVYVASECLATFQLSNSIDHYVQSHSLVMILQKCIETKFLKAAIASL